MSSLPPDGARHARTKTRSKAIHDHRDLRVWRKSRRLSALCQGLVSGFPDAQKSLAVIICRLAHEVPEEIARGQSTGQYAAYVAHLERARGSLGHLERRLIEAYNAGCLAADDGDPLLKLTAEIGRMVRKLLISLELSHTERRVKGRMKSLPALLGRADTEEP